MPQFPEGDAGPRTVAPRSVSQTALYRTGLDGLVGSLKAQHRAGVSAVQDSVETRRAKERERKRLERLVENTNRENRKDFLLCSSVPGSLFHEQCRFGLVHAAGCRPPKPPDKKIVALEEGWLAIPDSQVEFETHYQKEYLPTKMSGQERVFVHRLEE